jgi:hypothetical protein
LRSRAGWARLVVVVAACLTCACGGSGPAPVDTAIRRLVSESRPIGPGIRFRPIVGGRPIGSCRLGLGLRVGVHVEVFAANRVVLLPAGIGAERPFAYSAGRISGARCFGDLVTIDPTGVVLVRRGARLKLSALFRSWGQPLSPTRVGSFSTARGKRVAVFVDGHPWRGDPGGVPLNPHAEIVLEVGPYVPPHSTYDFPPGT